MVDAGADVLAVMPVVVAPSMVFTVDHAELLVYPVWVKLLIVGNVHAVL